MQFVSKPHRFSSPGHCILIPGRVVDDRGFIDTQMTLEGIRGDIQPYISAEGIRMAALRFPQLGLVDVTELEAAQEQVAHLTETVNILAEQKRELEAKFERINGLQRDGFKVVRQQGRPPVKKGA